MAFLFGFRKPYFRGSGPQIGFYLQKAFEFIGWNQPRRCRARTICLTDHQVVEAAGVEPASLANLPAATTCLVRRKFSSVRWRP